MIKDIKIASNFPLFKKADKSNCINKEEKMKTQRTRQINGAPFYWVTLVAQ